ncbi:YggS family pyridoxal phosphate-dependent enzyme [Vibrio aquimaris]|uniref:Pyridoxal phosphate homeostasis protein n=1 Tax=Vibrio aquimaris TaxID=2587862 RepID=A0A5P9CQB6_9VIBR|nr:YggS family pyridoxal phosphate-dependent enzyme [Vibrio aquimaris]QFT28414.1 hypothetical protein FIV01_18630 [Vibrio aquimaris]
MDNMTNACINFERIRSDLNPLTKLLAVSKSQPFEVIEPVLRQGHRLFGESRVEEAFEKWAPIKSTYGDIQLHYIGKLQSRKIGKIVQLFDVIQTVESISSLEKVAMNAEKYAKLQKVMIQINIGNEPQKSGVSIDDFHQLYERAIELKAVHLDGIMCIPPNTDQVRCYFESMKEIATEYQLESISMGMSQDYIEAINCGSTMIRVGRGIFGERNAK